MSAVGFGNVGIVLMDFATWIERSGRTHLTAQLDTLPL